MSRRSDSDGLWDGMSLNGQWIARYSGTNTGLLVAELDDFGDHYEGNAVLFDDNQELLGSVVKIRTPSKATAGAISVASAMFLILDLSQPYAGLFRVPASALQETIEAIDK
jgi:hypothetical protein